MDIRTKGLNHLCFPTYYRGPFVASNTENMYCTECYHTERRNSLSAPLRPYMRTPSRLRYRGPFVACKYCESTTHPVYHAKITVSTKNFPRSEGRKCGVKGPVAWLDGMVEILVKDSPRIGQAASGVW